MDQLDQEILQHIQWILQKNILKLMQIIEVKKIFVSTIALINCENEILICKRPMHGFLPSKWEFPGGKIHKNEYPEHAIIREAKEEIGINLTESCLAPLSFATYKYDNFFIILLLFNYLSYV